MQTNHETLWSLGNSLGFRAEGPGGWASLGMGIKEARVVLNPGVLHTQRIVEPTPKLMTCCTATNVINRDNEGQYTKGENIKKVGQL